MPWPLGLLAQAQSLSAWELLAGLFGLLLPFLVIFGLLAAFFNARGLFEELGLTGKEIGLLLVGGGSTVLLGVANIPLFASGDVLLMVHVGGAIIPVVVALHLVRVNRLHPLPVLASTGVVGLLAWLVTSFEPELGIVAEFPDFLLPPVAATACGLLLYGRSSSKAPALGYAAGTLGTLIGADLVRLPLLVQPPAPGEEGFAGSIGGAGIFDLVYLSGLIAFMLNLLLAAAVLRGKRDRIVAARSLADGVEMSRRKARRARVLARWQLAAMRELDAVNFKARQVAGFLGAKGYPRDLVAQFAPAGGLLAYEELAVLANRPDIAPAEALRAEGLAGSLVHAFDDVLRRYFAGPGARAAAFLVDLLIFGAAGVALFWLTWRAGRNLVEPELLLAAAFLLAWNLQLLYFTLLETFWDGRTVGKALLGLQVRSVELTRADFMSVFTRNVVRLLDMFLVLYAVSLTMIGVTRRRQRMGDLVGKTVVVDHRARAREGLPRAIDVGVPGREEPATSPGEAPSASAGAAA